MGELCGVNLKRGLVINIKSSCAPVRFVQKKTTQLTMTKPEACLADGTRTFSVRAGVIWRSGFKGKYLGPCQVDRQHE